MKIRFEILPKDKIAESKTSKSPKFQFQVEKFQNSQQTLQSKISKGRRDL